MRYPTSDRRVSSPYGYRTHPVTGENKLHAGADFPYPGLGAPLYAVANATVDAVGHSDAGGNWVRLRLDDGVEAIYFHMQARSPLHAGARIAQSSVVGYMGSTGSSTTGPHLHFETRRGGASFDPIPYLDAGIAAAGGAQPFPQPDEEQDEDMKNSGFYYTRSADKKRVNLIVNTGTGWWMEYLEGATIPAGSNNAVAGTFDTGAYASVGENFANALKASLPRAQGAVVSGSLTIAADET